MAPFLVYRCLTCMQMLESYEDICNVGVVEFGSVEVAHYMCIWMFQLNAFEGLKIYRLGSQIGRRPRSTDNFIGNQLDRAYDGKEQCAGHI